MKNLYQLPGVFEGIDIWLEGGIVDWHGGDLTLEGATCYYTNLPIIIKSSSRLCRIANCKFVQKEVFPCLENK